MAKFTQAQVKHMADLASIPLCTKEDDNAFVIPQPKGGESSGSPRPRQVGVARMTQCGGNKLAQEFSETLDVIANLGELDVSQTEPTHQVTGLENVWREDEVVQENIFSQDQALANASQTDGGFFVVPRIIDKDEF